MSEGIQPRQPLHNSRSYEECVARVGRMMDYMDSCFSLFDDDLYNEQVSAQITQPFLHYPTISSTGRPSPPKSTTGRVQLLRPPATGEAQPTTTTTTARRRERQTTTSDEKLDANARELRVASVNSELECRTLQGKDKVFEVNSNTHAKTHGQTFEGPESGRHRRRRPPRSPTPLCAATSHDEMKPVVSSLHGDMVVKPAHISAGSSTLVSASMWQTAESTSSDSSVRLLLKKVVPSKVASPLLVGPADNNNTPVPLSDAAAQTIDAAPQVAAPKVHPTNIGRPRRQASLRINEFVRAEAKLKGRRLNPRDMQRPSETLETPALLTPIDGGGGAAAVNDYDDMQHAENEIVVPIKQEPDDAPLDTGMCDDQKDVIADCPAENNTPGNEGKLAHAGDYSCFYCDRVFVQPDAMEQHIMDEHVYPIARGNPTSNSPASSDAEDSSAQDTSAESLTKIPMDTLLVLHSKHNNKERLKNISHWECLICEKVFRSWRILKRHLAIHTGEKPYKCTYRGCGFASVQKCNLKVHINIVHNRLPK